MKKLFFYFIAVFMLSSVALSQELEIIEEIDLQEMHSKGIYKYESTEIFTSKKVNIGNYSAYHLGLVINDILIKHCIKDKRNIILLIDDRNGNSYASDIFSFDEENAVIPAIAAFEKVKAKKSDTIRVFDKNGKELMPDIKGIDEAMKAGATKRLFTPVPNISKEEIARLFRGFTIVFPEDKTTTRWIADAVRIRIYMIKHH